MKLPRCKLEFQNAIVLSFITIRVNVEVCPIPHLIGGIKAGANFPARALSTGKLFASLAPRPFVLLAPALYYSSILLLGGDV